MPRLLSLVLACLAVGLLVATTAAATPKPGTAKVGKGGHATGPAPAAGGGPPPPRKAHDLRDTGAPAGKLESGPSWIDGAADYDWTSDCITGPAILGNSWVGWYGEIGSSPVVNDVYYIHVVWGVTADPCSGGAYTHIEIALPSFTQLAISSGNPVFCYYQSPSAATASRFTSGCPQGPTGVGMYGGLSFDPTSGSAAWPTAFGAIFELQIPVKTSKPLDGLILGGGNGCPACLYSGTWMIDGVFSPWLFPVQGVYVKQGAPPAVPPPYVDYPVPNHYQDGSTATQWWTAGFAFTEGTSGTIYSYLGEGPSGTF